MYLLFDAVMNICIPRIYVSEASGHPRFRTAPATKILRNQDCAQLLDELLTMAPCKKPTYCQIERSCAPS